jgi:hypothetical protein
VVPDTDHRDDKPAIAAAFHDIDAFTSLNYLGLSIGTMDAWLQRTGRDAWGAELAFTRTVPRAVVRHLKRHPLDPLPITRARRPLKQAGYAGADR